MSKVDLNSNTSMTPYQYLQATLGISLKDWMKLSENEKDELRHSAVLEMKQRGIEVRP